MDKNRSLEIFILLALLAMLLGIVTLVGKSEEIVFEPNETSSIELEYDDSIITLTDNSELSFVAEPNEVAK